MSKENRVVVLIGSPKASKSTSESLGNYLIEQLAARGAHTEKIHVSKVLRSIESTDNMMSAVDKADTVILVSPLYVDSLPYPVTKAFELISEYRQGAGTAKAQKLVAIMNCGFPEAHQNDTAIAICRLFARKIGFEWAGGLALGMGGTIDGQALEKLGGMLRNVKRALELTADAIVAGSSVPQEVVDLMAKPFIPKWLYVLVGNFGWITTSKKYGANKNLRARPYES
jgi:hypothetical protein